MKLFFTLTIFIALSMSLKSQQFNWAESYDISNCNEVAALATDTSGNLFITGVHDASVFLPYTGNSYILKTDPDGEVMWTEYIIGDVQIGDMAAIGSSIVIIGKTNGTFSYKGEQYGSNEYAMFIMKIDSSSNMEWNLIDATKFGANTNLAPGKFGDIAVHVRGQSNLGDWVWILDTDGNILNTKEIYTFDSPIVSMAYYNGWVYLNGGFNGPGSIIIDTIVINVPPVESVTFTLALDDNLVAKWVSTDTTINNRDGRVVANSSGVFVYENVLEPPFTVVTYIKKFNFEGQLIHEIVAPIFTEAIALYPDMTITPTMLGLFVHDDFTFNSQAVFLFDHNLNLISEKFINGPSDLYSGQITNFEDDIFVAHVYEGDLEFSDEIILPYAGTGKLPYIAKIGSASTTGLAKEKDYENGFRLYPNPATDKVNLIFQQENRDGGELSIFNSFGHTIYKQNFEKLPAFIDLANKAPGIYIFQVQAANGEFYSEKIILK